jgi:hypothetical protein
MPTTIKLKNSVTTTSAPSSLVQGEVAINITDKKVWVGNAATTPVQLLGTGADGTFTNISVTSVATFGAGTVSAPSITTTGDTNTGIFFPAADTIAFTEGGVESARFNSLGYLGIGTNNPAGPLHVVGTTDQIRAGNGTITSFLGGAGAGGFVGTISSHDFSIFSGSVARIKVDTNGLVSIGANTSTFGTLNVQRFAGAPYATVTIQDNATPANTIGLYLRQNGTDPAGISTAGAPLAFYVGGAGAGEGMRLTSTSRVGINYSTPSGRLDVANDGTDSFFRHSSGTYLRIVTQTANGRVQLQADATNGAYPEFDFFAGGSARFTIGTNGQQASTIVGSAGTYNNYQCRAWVNFNGAGTVAINGSGNVTSITDNGTGDYTVNLTTALPDVNYAPVLGVGNTDGSEGAIRIKASLTTSATRVATTFLGGNAKDCNQVTVAIFR